jgi:hypothetical protein
MQGNFTLNIDEKITEQQLIENCLAYYHSGYDYKVLLFLYAFGKQWNYDKLIYYVELIGDKI